MRFLLDMNLSPNWVNEFAKRGIDAVHWFDVGAGHAADSQIMAYAREHDFIIFTHDLDFGTLLAVTNAESPSVIQIRVQDVSPEALADRFFAAIDQFADHLQQGALLIVDAQKERVRLLPLRKRNGF